MNKEISFAKKTGRQESILIRRKPIINSKAGKAGATGSCFFAIIE
jgi:hypothetical protein